MGAITGLIGGGGGAAGTGFGGPGASSQGVANIVNPVSQDQANQANTGSQNSLQAQQALLTALQGQNGLGNQSQVYNQLQGVVNGTGPNPAQAQLAQATAANTQNQAALMAGQRGSSANAGLIARQAAQQGAANQQQAAGQAATLQANQSLNALGQAGSIAGTQAANQIGQTNANTSAQQQQQQMLLNSIAQANNANVGMQSNVNNVNGQLANTTMQGQQSMLGGIMNGAGAVMGSMADGGDVDDIGSPNTSTPTFSAPAAKSSGGGGGGIMSILPMLAMAAEGGDINTNPSVAAAQTPNSASSKFGKFLKGASGGSNSGPQGSPAQSAVPMTGPAALQQGTSSFVSGLGKMLSPAATPQNAGQGPTQVASGAMGAGIPYAQPAPAGFASGGQTHDYRSGGKVNAKNAKEKAKVAGNSYSNDTIPAILSEHEIVLPRTVTMSKDPINASAKFVAQVLAKRKGKK